MEKNSPKIQIKVDHFLEKVHQALKPGQSAPPKVITQIWATVEAIRRMLTSTYEREMLLYANYATRLLNKIKNDPDGPSLEAIRIVKTAIHFALLRKSQDHHLEHPTTGGKYIKMGLWVGLGGLLLSMSALPDIVSSLPHGLILAIAIAGVVYAAVDMLHTITEQQKEFSEHSKRNHFLGRASSLSPKILLTLAITSAPLLFASLDFLPSMDMVSLIGGIVAFLLVGGLVINALTADRSALKSARAFAQKSGLRKQLRPLEAIAENTLKKQAEATEDLECPPLILTETLGEPNKVTPRHPPVIHADEMASGNKPPNTTKCLSSRPELIAEMGNEPNEDNGEGDNEGSMAAAAA